jgi:DNA-binding FadR family transcriptional regulator
MIPLSNGRYSLVADGSTVRFGGFPCAGHRRSLLLFHIAFLIMENSHRIEPEGPLFSDGKAYALAEGENPSRRSAAARIALQLENAMVRDGWPAGHQIGSERALAERLGASRETMRAAIRILEQRGSMQMVRGRFGGLVACRPGPEPAAASLALYLRARGTSPTQLADALRLVDGKLARFAAAAGRGARPAPSLRRSLAAIAGSRGLELYASLADSLAPPAPPALAEALLAAVAAGDADRAEALAADIPAGPATDPGQSAAAGASGLRSVAIAARLLDRLLGPEIERGGRIGSEWELACEFDTCRATLRQALGMLEDLDLIEPRRGRGGGYVAKRPSPGGAIRHAYLFLVLGRPDALPVMRLLDALNIVHLRLAAARLAPLPPGERRRRLRDFSRFAVEGDPDTRLLRVLEELGRIADNPLVDTLLRCLVAAQARASMTDASLPEPVRTAILIHHRAVAKALAMADLPLAEDHFRAVQQLLWQSCPAGTPPPRAG